MKKLVLVLTIFLSSFFFINKVSAQDFTSNLTQAKLDLITSTAGVKECADSLMESNSSYTNYIVIQWGSSTYIFLNNTDNLPYISFSNNHISISFRSSKSYKYSGSCSTITEANNYVNVLGIYEDSFTNFPLYSSSDIIFADTIYNSNFTFNYTDFTYTVTASSTTKAPTLYNLYCMINGISEEESQDNVIEDFYSLLTAKIILLGNDFATNPILLAVLVIFIVIFLFELIFRRKI